MSNFHSPDGDRSVDAATIARISERVPRAVVAVCEQLSAAGFEAVTVGGAVRDALLGREPGDWDVATSAPPTEVIALFPHTIPTGLQHGTVTVVYGRGHQRVIVEVTTYRGEGAYTDGRRPDQVNFGVPLVEDLARRDFVINAMAFDPVSAVLIDPFGGRGDLLARQIRAVGDATARFTEDGLRVMRAVRFAASLGFALDPETVAGIRPALPSLHKVAWERIWIELEKTLRAAAPGPSLQVAYAEGILDHVLPEALVGGAAAFAARCAVVDAAATVNGRLWALLEGCEASAARDAMKRLKAKNADQGAVAHAVAMDRKYRDCRDRDPKSLRRIAHDIGRAHAALVLEGWAARAKVGGDGVIVAGAESWSAASVEALGEVFASGTALAVGELAVSGRDLLAELGHGPGPWVGSVLEALLTAVLTDPSMNERDKLLALAKTVAAG